jgi:hypothetical protein
MITALLAAHLWVLPWKLLFVLPGKACGVTSLRFGPADGKWESGSNPTPADCHFRVSVEPGPLVPAWADLPPKPVDDVEVTYTLQGGDKPQNAAVKAEKVEPAAAEASAFSARAAKVKDSVRVEVTNKSSAPVVLGDSVALRGKPKDECLGPGAATVLAPGETLIDQRPGLLSPSMKIWVSVFTAEKQCRWVEVPRKP